MYLILLRFPRGEWWCLGINPSASHQSVPLSLNDICRDVGLELSHFLWCQLHRESPYVLVQVIDLGSSRYGAHVLSSVVDPSQCQPRRGAALSCCHFSHLVKNYLVWFKIIFLEPWHVLQNKSHAPVLASSFVMRCCFCSYYSKKATLPHKGYFIRGDLWSNIIWNESTCSNVDNVMKCSEHNI